MPKIEWLRRNPVQEGFLTLAVCGNGVSEIEHPVWDWAVPFVLKAKPRLGRTLIRNITAVLRKREISNRRDSELPD